MQNFHAQAIEQIMQDLHTSKKGLEQKQVEKAREKYGTNIIKTEKK